MQLTRRQQFWILTLGLPLLVICLLALAQFGLEPSRRCTQFPKWFECLLSRHENLAGGLIGAAGALFAGWLAWTAVRDQISDERRREREANEIRLEQELKSKKSRADSFTAHEAHLRKIYDFHDYYLAQVGPNRRWRNCRAFVSINEMGHLTPPIGYALDPAVLRVHDFLAELRQFATSVSHFIELYDQRAAPSNQGPAERLDHAEKECERRLKELDEMSDYLYRARNENTQELAALESKLLALGKSHLDDESGHIGPPRRRT